MYDTTLDICFRIDRFHRLFQSRQAVEDAKKDFFQTAGMQVKQNLPPAERAFLSADIKAENFPVAVFGYADSR